MSGMGVLVLAAIRVGLGLVTGTDIQTLQQLVDRVSDGEHS
jgi:hypothetical protein